jgi:phosphate regulon transcriptional regulator PhoB
MNLPLVERHRKISKWYNDPMTQRIMMIEDEADIVQLVRYGFEKEGYQVVSFHRAQDALEDLHRKTADLVLLDILLPDLNGLEICRRMRADERLKHVPVIFLTAKGEEIDRVLGLELGADDYVVKPFSPRELLARVKAVLRRHERIADQPQVIERGELNLDCGTQAITVRGKPIEVSTLEFKLLHFLVTHPGRIFSRDVLLDQVWGQDRFVTPRTIDVHIRRLREKIEEFPNEPRYLLTVRGAGYRFADKLEPVTARA